MEISVEELVIKNRISYYACTIEDCKQAIAKINKKLVGLKDEDSIKSKKRLIETYINIIPAYEEKVINLKKELAVFQGKND